MWIKSELQTKLLKHLCQNKISVTITDPQMDHIPVLLNVIISLLQNDLRIRRVIILASKRSIEYEWLPHLHRKASCKQLSYVAALGKEKRKIKALTDENRIILTNDESLSWIRNVAIGAGDMLILDELARYRKSKSERYQIVKSICARVNRVAAFSRIPIAQELSEIWEEFYLVDNGRRLGQSKQAFLDRYFFVNQIWVDGHAKIYTDPKESAVKAIGKAVRDICMDLTSVNDNSQTPFQKRNVYVDLSSSEQSRYRLMEKELLFPFQENKSITTSDTFFVAGKLLQLASGTIYDNEKNVIHFHDRKVEALKLLIEEYPANNILVAYRFKHELLHLLEMIPPARAILDRNDIADWNTGKIRIGLINSSMGGTRQDLKDGGNILIWFSLTWSLSSYIRTNERISQHKGNSLIIHMIANNTIDEIVLKNLEAKDKDNRQLLDAMRSVVS